MDSITARVREMYELFPYPSGAPAIRAGSDVGLVLSYIDRSEARRPGTLRALDAGCGRGLGTIGHAATQPHIEFIGIDISRAALADARAEAEKRKLSNVRFQEVDLMTLAGLDVPVGGFDVIYSSGVLHHLSDPLLGLKKLREALAPDGVIVFMVYGTYGRAPLYRLKRALEIMAPDSFPLEQRLRFGKGLCQALLTDTISAGPWGNAANVADAEFVDRYLHVNETSYTVDSLFDLIRNAGLRFLRWIEPREWSVEQFPEGPARNRASELSELDLFRLIEQLFWREKLELIICHEEAVSRRGATDAELLEAVLQFNPEVQLSFESRVVPSGLRWEGIRYKLRARESELVPTDALRHALLGLRDQVGPFPSEALRSYLVEQGIPDHAATATVRELLERELLFRPHW